MSADEWIPCSERLPETRDGRVLVRCSKHPIIDDVVSATWIYPRGWLRYGETLENVTHWRPMLPPPR